jgi:hypothetical protein
MFAILTAAQVLRISIAYAALSCVVAFLVARKLPGLRENWLLPFLALCWLLLGPVWTYAIRNQLGSSAFDLMHWQMPPVFRRSSKAGRSGGTGTSNEDASYALARQFLKPSAYAFYDRRNKPLQDLDQLTPAELALGFRSLDTDRVAHEVLNYLDRLAAGTRYPPGDWFVTPTPQSVEAMVNFVSLWDPTLRGRCQQIANRWMNERSESPVK